MIGFSNVTGNQYLIPVGKQNIMTMTVFIGAAANVVFNLILIPHFYSVGAAIASVIAETCVTVSGFIYLKRKKMIELKPILTCSWRYWIAGGIMFAVLYPIQYLLPDTVWSLAVLIVGGIALYFLALILLKDSFVMDAIRKGLQLMHIRKKDAESSKNSEKENECEAAQEEVTDESGIVNSSADDPIAANKENQTINGSAPSDKNESG